MQVSIPTSCSNSFLDKEGMEIFLFPCLFLCKDESLFFLPLHRACSTDDKVVAAMGVALGERALIAFRGDSSSSSSGWYALLRLLDDGAGGG